jgi:hypothetical protein
MFIKNKNDNNYTGVTKSVYHILADRFGYTARISDIWELLRYSFGIEEFELLNPRLYQNGMFESYLLDELIKWQKGEDVNFTDIYQAILTVGDFTGREKLMFDYGNIEERLWAIFLVICNPEMNI